MKISLSKFLDIIGWLIFISYSNFPSDFGRLIQAMSQNPKTSRH